MRKIGRHLWVAGFLWTQAVSTAAAPASARVQLLAAQRQAAYGEHVLRGLCLMSLALGGLVGMRAHDTTLERGLAGNDGVLYQGHCHLGPHEVTMVPIPGRFQGLQGAQCGSDVFVDCGWMAANNFSGDCCWQAPEVDASCCSGPEGCTATSNGTVVGCARNDTDDATVQMGYARAYGYTGWFEYRVEHPHIEAVICRRELSCEDNPLGSDGCLADQSQFPVGSCQFVDTDPCGTATRSGAARTLVMVPVLLAGGAGMAIIAWGLSGLSRDHLTGRARRNWPLAVMRSQRPTTTQQQTPLMEPEMTATNQDPV